MELDTEQDLQKLLEEIPLVTSLPRSTDADSCGSSLRPASSLDDSLPLKQRRFEPLPKHPQQQFLPQEPCVHSRNLLLERRVGEQRFLPYLLPDEDLLSSAFASVSLESNRPVKCGLQPLHENGNGYNHHGGVISGDAPSLQRCSLRSSASLASSRIGSSTKSHLSMEPMSNGSFPVLEGPIRTATAQKLQKLMSQESSDSDWNPMLQATSGGVLPRAYLQCQQFANEHQQFLRQQQQQSPFFPVATGIQSGRASLHESLNSGSNGFQTALISPEQCYSGNQMLEYGQQQKLHLARQSAEERQHQQWHQRFSRHQQLLEQQSSLYARLQSQAGATLLASCYPNHYASPAFPSIPLLSSAPLHQSGAMAAVLDDGWSSRNLNTIARMADHGMYCRYNAQGCCVQGDACPSLDSHSPGFEDAGASHMSSTSLQQVLAAAVAAQEDRLGAYLPGRLIPRSSPQSQEEGPGRKNATSNGRVLTNDNGDLPFLNQRDTQKLLDLPVSGPHTHPLQQQGKFSTLEELQGRIYDVAKDQHGCRFLQRKFDDGSPDEVRRIFEEISGHIVELMTDPFGNYLVQKLLEVCSEAQRMEILQAVTQNDALVTISLNMHGTRAVQKLIETLSMPEQIAMAISSLKQGVVTLIKDLNGNHVVQRCLQCFSNEDNQFIFDAAARHCVEIASHRHGCCVLQRCVDFASGVHRQCLVAEIAANSLTLSQDPFGNYVVQYILGLGLPWALEKVMAKLEGSYPYLSMQKFSSNVVEKCLKLATDDGKARIVSELVASSLLGQLLQDPYANYVIQRALQVTKGTFHASLVNAIRPHVPALRSSPYGKRILSRTHLKK